MLLGALTVLVSSCALPARIPPAAPLPEVRFIAPGDPAAVIALSADDEINLKQRDRLLRDRIRKLEELLQPE
jgi:hypothetical protein